MSLSNLSGAITTYVDTQGELYTNYQLTRRSLQQQVKKPNIASQTTFTWPDFTKTCLLHSLIKAANLYYSFYPTTKTENRF